MRRNVITVWGVLQVVVLLLIPVGAAAAFHAWLSYESKLERLASQIDGVRVVAIRRYGEAWNIKCAAILLDVNGRRVGFDAVRPSDFTYAESIRLIQFDDWELEQSGVMVGTEDDRFGPRRSFGGGVLIGANGEFGQHFSPPLRNLKEAIEQVEQIAAILDAIPEERPGLRQEWGGEILHTIKIRIQGAPIHPDFFHDAR